MTYLIECIGIGKLLIIRVPSMYVHCWLSSVVSDRRIAPAPSKLSLPYPPVPVPVPGPGAPLGPSFLDSLLKVNWLVKPPLMPEIAVVPFVFLLARLVVLDAIDLVSANDIV